MILLGLIRLDLACGQTLDSAMAEQKYSRFYLADDIARMDFRSHNEDTMLHFLHLLHPMKAKGLAWLDQGQIGTPALDLWETAPVWASRMRATTGIMDPYVYHSSDTRYYFGTQPRSDLTYSQGTGDLIYLKAEHAQNVFNRWSFGLDYTRLKSNNVYYGNLADFTKIRIPNHYYTRIYSHFYTKNLKYEVFTAFSWNKSRITETGGVENVARFDTLEGRAKFFFNEARLQNAENALVQTHWQVQQFFRPGGRTIQVGDSFTADTLRSTIRNQWFHKMDIHWDRANFRDPDATESFYPNAIYSFSTNDSIRVFNWINRFGYQQFLGKTTQVRGYGELELAHMEQFPGHEARYQTLRLGSDIEHRDERTYWNLQIDAVPVGYYGGDHRFRADYGLLRANWDLGVRLENRRMEPDFNTQYFGSNHYYWNVGLNKMSFTSLQLRAGNDSAKVCTFFAYEAYSGYIYYDTSSRPVQIADGFGRLRGGLNYKLHFAGKFTLEQQIGWQQKVLYMRLPELVSRSRLYWEGYTFHGNMLLRTGLDVYYMSAFDGLSYNPVIRQFHWDDSRRSGAYPIFDVFVNAKVNSMEIFFLWQHVSDGIFGYDFYSANTYPLLYRSVRFGLSWRLFN